jgi:hypothetical protein
VTEDFFTLLHSGAIHAHELTNADRRALLELLKDSLNGGGGRAKFDAVSSGRESA